MGLPIIQVDDLVKEYKQYQKYKGLLGSFRSLITRKHEINKAVDGISFNIEAGEAVGYLGPNGAGKSTMIKMLTGVLMPSSGQVNVFGCNPYTNRRKNTQRIGVVFGQRSQLWWDLPVMDSFELHKYIYKLSSTDYKRNLDFCIELLDLGSFVNKPVRMLSLGQRMRSDMALSLLHQPEILFLDEPTIGLDVLAKDRIREFLRTVNKERNVTIILTTHDLKDIEEVCPRMLIVNKGTKVFDGLVQELKTQIGGQSFISIEFENDPGILDFGDCEVLVDDGKLKKIKVNQDKNQAIQVLSRLSLSHPIRDFSVQEAGIEDVMRSMYRKLNES